MNRYQSAFHLAFFRHRLLVWLLLLSFCFSLFPSVSLAQQISATIRSLRGNVVVSGGKARVGTILHSGDSISTWDGASVLLRLSDGSEIQIGENTRINIEDLRQTSAGGRASALTMLVGWMRATLSPDHQRADSSFTVNTPNAQIGTRFSEPKFSVYVSPDQDETQAMAHTIELVVTNRLSGERVVIPVGSSAIVKGMSIQVFPRILDPFEGPGSDAGPGDQPPSGGGTEAGLGTGTKVLIGAGALALAGGVAAVILMQDNEENSNNGVESTNNESEPIDGGFEPANNEPEATGKCGELLASSSDTYETHVIELGKRSGSFQFEYQTDSIEDQMIVEYEGRILFNSGCIATDFWQARSIRYSGESSKVSVRVIPNCRDTYDSNGAFWEFVVYCP